MMINWAEKQAPEDRRATEDVLDTMTQYRVEEQEKLCRVEVEQEQQDNLELLQKAVTMLRRRLGRSQGMRRLKSELSRERA